MKEEITIGCISKSVDLTEVGPVEKVGGREIIEYSVKLSVFKSAPDGRIINFYFENPLTNK